MCHLFHLYKTRNIRVENQFYTSTIRSSHRSYSSYFLEALQNENRNSLGFWPKIAGRSKWTMGSIALKQKLDRRKREVNASLSNRSSVLPSLFRVILWKFMANCVCNIMVYFHLLVSHCSLQFYLIGSKWLNERKVCSRNPIKIEHTRAPRALTCSTLCSGAIISVIAICYASSWI